MSKRLSISENLDLPLDFVTERIAFLARTGAGKSGGMRVLFEALLDAGQFVIFVDPKGDAWGIRAAGVGAGYPVLVMGGDHGDVPLEATAGKFIAEFLVKERVSTVLDISDFGKADMVRFVTDLASTLYRRNRDVVHVFLDEADMIAGEKFYDPKCLEAIQLIQNKGRHRGFGVTVATQRQAMINKSVLYACGTLVAMQTTAPKDIKVVREWLEVVATPDEAKVIVSALPSLQTREALIYSPQFLSSHSARIRFKTFRTFDSMRTPRPGETRQQPKSLADIDLTAIQRDMAATIEKAKAEDPKELQKRIRELERQVKTAIPDPNMIESAVNKAVQQAEDRFEYLQRQNVQAINDLRGRLDKIAQLAHLNGSAPAIAEYQRAAPVVIKPQPTTLRTPAPRPARPPVEVGDLKLNRTQQRILDALAWFESIGNTEPSNIQVGAIALIDATGGHFSNTVGPLSSAGLIERREGRMTLTDAGRSVAAIPDSISTLNDYHDVLRRRVKQARSASNRTVDMLNAIIACAGDETTTKAIGEAVGIDHTGGHFSNTIGPLSTLGLIERQGGYVRPTDVLFPPGLS